MTTKTPMFEDFVTCPRGMIRTLRGPDWLLVMAVIDGEPRCMTYRNLSSDPSALEELVISEFFREAGL